MLPVTLNGPLFASFEGTYVKMYLNPPDGFTISGDKIVSIKDPGMVLDICAGSKEAGAKLLKYKWHGKDNQRWAFEDPKGKSCFQNHI